MVKSIIVIIHNNTYQNLWEKYFLPRILPLLLGLGLGLLVALLIARDIWLAAIVVVIAVPAVLLLIKYPLLAVMIWFLLMPYLPFSTVSPRVFWVIHRALIPMALGLTILPRMLKVKKYEPVQLGWAELSMLIYLMVGAASIIITRQEPLLYLYELYDRMFVPFAAYWLIRFVSPTEQDIKRWFPTILMACLGLIITGFWAQYALQTLPPIWSITREPGRMSGTIGNPTPYAITLIACLVFLFHYTMTCAKKALKPFLFLVFAIGMFCIFLTFTRGCWGAAVLVLLGLLFLYPRPILSLLGLIMPIVVILSASVLANEVSFALQRLNTQDTVDSRVVLAHAGEEMFFAKPIFGWGFGNYDRYDWQFMERVGNASPSVWDIKKGTSHNTYLTILAEMGAVGFFFQFFPLFWWLIQSFKTWPRLPQRGFWSRHLLIIFWLSIIAYLVSSQVVDMRFFWYQIGTWWLTLGVIGSIVDRYRNQEI